MDDSRRRSNSRNDNDDIVDSKSLKEKSRNENKEEHKSKSSSHPSNRNDRRSRSDSRDRRNRSRERNRDRERDRDRGVRRRRSRSPRRDSRDRRERRRSRSRTRSLSPLSKKSKARSEAIAAKAEPPPRFWDGFQWVDRLKVIPPSIDEIHSGTVPPIAIGNQKDRRIYVGNLPPGMTTDQLKEFVNSAMAACGGVPPGIPSAVLSVWMGPDNKYSFVELCSSESALVALGLNGITYNGVSLKIARPKSYSDASIVSTTTGALTSALASVPIGMGLQASYPTSTT